MKTFDLRGTTMLTQHKVHDKDYAAINTFCLFYINKIIFCWTVNLIYPIFTLSFRVYNHQIDQITHLNVFYFLLCICVLKGEVQISHNTYDY